MRKFAQACSLAFLIVCVSTPAAADPIRILSGIFTVDLRDPFAEDGNAQMGITGERGLSLTGTWVGVVPTAEVCMGGTCQPGDLVSPDISGGVGVSLMTLGGVTLIGSGSLSFNFDGPEFPLVVPPGSTSFVSAPVPFVFSGVLNPPCPAGFFCPAVVETLAGTGFVTISFAAGPNGYGSIRSTYQFADAPVPEPASLLLLGSGLGLVARRVVRRRNAVVDR